MADPTPDTAATDECEHDWQATPKRGLLICATCRKVIQIVQEVPGV